MKHRDNNELGWADRPGPQRVIRWVLYGICGALILAELFFHRHTTNKVEEIPGFYMLVGFVSLVVAVTLAKGLRRWVKRDEDYYDRNR